MGGVEPPTSSLPRTRSNHLSYMGTDASPCLSSLERETGLEPATPSLEGLCSSQLSYSRRNLSVYVAWWRGEDSNLRRLMPTGLQPVPVDRFGTSPGKKPRAISSSAFTRAKSPDTPSTPVHSRRREAVSILCCSLSRSVKPSVRLASPRPPARCARWRCRSNSLPDCASARVASRGAPAQRARSWRGDSNLQPADYKSAALPIELRQRKRRVYQEISFVPPGICGLWCARKRGHRFASLSPCFRTSAVRSSR